MVRHRELANPVSVPAVDLRQVDVHPGRQASFVPAIDQFVDEVMLVGILACLQGLQELSLGQLLVDLHVVGLGEQVWLHHSSMLWSLEDLLRRSLLVRHLVQQLLLSPLELHMGIVHLLAVLFGQLLEHCLVLVAGLLPIELP